MMIEKCFSLRKETRPDIYTSVDFLTTRVQKVSKDDWNKMLSLLKYFNRTMDLPLILSANVNGTLVKHCR